MAISINWATAVITVPKANTTLVQSTPIEIRELNLNTFRLTLKDLEDDFAGIGFQKTHDHNTIVTISGVELARVINVLPPYTVTFEDGAYAVNLVGANSNVADRLNLNQVSVRAANSAGLVQTRAIEFASFEGGVTIDAVDGLDSNDGTSQSPVQTMSRVYEVLSYRGLKKIYIVGNLTLGATDDVSGLTLVGEDSDTTTITLTSGNLTVGAKMKNLTLTGVCGGRMEVDDCILYNITGFCASGGNSYIRNTIVKGTINLNSIADQEYHFINCHSGGVNAGVPVLDVNGVTAKILIRNFNGGLKLTNITSGNSIHINLNSGGLVFDSSDTNGDVLITGVGVLNNTSSITPNTEGFMNKTNIADSILDTSLTAYDTADTVGLSLASSVYAGILFIDTVSGSAGTEYPVGTFNTPVNNLANALTLSTKYGLNHWHLHSNLTITTGTNLTEKVIESHRSFENTITLNSGAILHDTIFRDIKVTGVIADIANFDYCFIENLSGLHGVFNHCVFNGTNTCSTGAGFCNMMSCKSYSQTPAIFDVDNSILNISDWWGMIQFAGKNGTAEVNVGMTWGYCIVTPTCTLGTIYVVGNGLVTSNTGGTVVNTDNLQDSSWYADANWAKLKTDTFTPNSLGDHVRRIKNNRV